MKKNTKIIIGFSTILSLSLGLAAVSCEAPVIHRTNIENNLEYSNEINKLNSAANAVMFSVENSEKIYASDVKKEMIKVKNINERQYKINIEEVYKNSDQTSVIVVYSLQTKIDNLKSESKVSIVKGFKKLPLTLDELNQKTELVKFDVNNIDKVTVNNVDNKSIKPKGIDLSKFDVNIEKIEKDSNTNSLIVKFQIIDKADNNKSKLKSYKVLGFKRFPLLKNVLNKLAENVTFDYAKKEIVLAKDANINDLIKPILPNSNVELKINRFEKNSDNTVTVNYKIQDKIYNENFSNDYSIKINGFKIPKITLDKLNEDNAKLSFEYLNISDTFVKDILKENLKPKNIDLSKIGFVLNKILPNENQTSVNIVYSIYDKNYPTNILYNQTKTLSGFKIPILSEKDLNLILKNISFEYKDKNNVFASDANLSGITVNNSNESTEVSLISVNKSNTNDQSVLVNLKLIDKNYPTKFIKTEIKIDGFKHPPISSHDLDKYVQNVVLDYPQKSEIFASDIDDKKILFTSYPKNLAKVEVVSVNKNNKDRSITVQYTLNDLNSENKSSIITKTLKEFKILPLTALELIKEAKKVMFSYENKKDVLSSLAEKQKIIGNGNDETITRLEINSFKTNLDNDGIVISFKIIDSNYNQNSFESTFELKGFKKTIITVADLGKLADNVKIDYPLKSKILATDVTKDKIIFDSYPKNSTVVNIVKLTKDSKKRLITVQYTLDDPVSLNKSEIKTKTIDGFRIMPLTNQELAAENKKLTFTYENKESILSSATIKEKIIGNGFNNAKVNLEIKTFLSNTNKDGILITYKLIDINYDDNYIENVMELKGFKEPKISKEILNSLSNSIDVGYTNKDKTLASNAKTDDVTFSGDLTRVTPQVVSVKPKTDSQRSVEIVYKLIDKNYADNLITVTKELYNFKELPLTKDMLDKELKKVVLTINNPEIKTVDQINNSDYILLGVDSKKFAIEVKQKDILTRTSIKIKYVLKEIDGTTESSEAFKEFDNLKPSLKIETAYTRPANVFERSQSIANPTYDVSIGSSESVFDFKSEGAHSYRIPSILKLKNGDLIISADKRIKSAADHTDGAIDQVIKRSKDNGQTWSKNEQVLKISAPRLKNGLTIDGVLNEVWIDKTDHKKGTKLLYMADTFTGFNGLGNLLAGFPFVKVGSEAVWKAWVRDTSSGRFQTTQYVFRKVPNRHGWWRLYSLPSRIFRDTITESNLSSLTPTQTYLNTNYDPVNRSVSGQIYENVEETDFDSPSLLNTKSTIYSIFDNNSSSDSKYAVSVNNYNLLIESYDNGKTWTNSKITDYYWRYGPEKYPFMGSGVGNGIQLKHQKDPLLNGRIIFPMYTFEAGGIEHSLYIYSDDNGETWHQMDFLNTLPRQNSESTMIEMENGDLYWLFRNHTLGISKGAPWISKSTDGGKTWKSPIEGDTKTAHELTNPNLDGDLYTGFTHFKIKGQDYFLFAAPDNKRVSTRRSGGLFITKDWKNIVKVWSFDTSNASNAEHFGYSYPITVEVGENYADIVLAYEWNKKVTYPGQPRVAGREPGAAITVDRFRVIPK